jgi:hypothetical protein
VGGGNGAGINWGCAAGAGLVVKSEEGRESCAIKTAAAKREGAQPRNRKRNITVEFLLVEVESPWR